MIDSATGMKPGERYSVESVEGARNFPGFFLDAKYYLHPELMTAVGWLEGQQFLYDELDAQGEPVFPGRVAGTIEDLTLVLNDGARLKLQKVQVRAQEDSAGFDSVAPSAVSEEQSVDQTQPVRTAVKHGPTLLVAGVAALLLTGVALALGRKAPGRRRR